MTKTISSLHGASRTGRVGMLCLAAMLVSACGGTEDDTEATVNAQQLKVSTPAEIAQTSAEDYDANINGLITGATLKRWKDDWANERPAGITGKLVILQQAVGPVRTQTDVDNEVDAATNDNDPATDPLAVSTALYNYAYITSADPDVATYWVPSSDWTQTRSNGVTATRSMVLDGAGIDALLQKHNIDPTKDMIVCAQGTGSTGNAMAQGRCWYTLRYWGVDANHLALLNGSNDWQVTNTSMTAADFAPTADAAPANGTFSVTKLKNDNTALQATLEDMLAILPSSDSNVLGDGVFIWDARSLDQYSAGEMGESGSPAADYMTTFQNGNSRQGHPWGALQLNFTNLLVAAEGWRYKDKADLQSYLDGNVVNGKGFADATYQQVGAGNAYQAGDTVYTYCETTFRAMITGVATAVVLGKPTRFYDGAMVEWSSMSNIVDKEGNYLMPVDSPWRTDVVSYYKQADSASKVETRDIPTPYANSANAIVKADREYKLGISSGDSGGGSLVPANPCGG